MIVAERKPFEEILDSLEGAQRVAVVGCGTCVAVCMAGGETEVGTLAAELRMALTLRGREVETHEATPQRQCDEEFIQAIADEVAGFDVVLSMACGAGVQMMAEHLAPTRVVPAVNTRFIGVTIKPGHWTEYCRACGECVLDQTSGVCPVARCSKGLLNGPCGGSQNGACEINPDIECAWQLIHDRLQAQGRIELMERYVKPRSWRSGHHGGPRRLHREDLFPDEDEELDEDDDTDGDGVAGADGRPARVEGQG